MPIPLSDFELELQTIINRYSKENDSNTPDRILASFMMGCLASFNHSVNKREAWYGRTPAHEVYLRPEEKKS